MCTVFLTSPVNGSVMRAATADVARNPAGSAQRFAAAARSYVGLLRDHIAKENGVLFPLADRTLSESEKRALALGFERVEHEDMGPGTHERYLALARGLCERLGVAWVPHAIATHACCGHRDGCPAARPARVGSARRIQQHPLDAGLQEAPDLGDERLGHG